jgi:predicted phosphoribosyltransferase
VAAEVAACLEAPLEVMVVRKIGAPGRPELAMGALAMVGTQVSLFRNEDVIAALGIGEAEFAAVHDRELAELQRRSEVFRRADPTPIAGADVVLVDDGLATGSTMLAAVAAVRGLEPARVVVGVPVASRQAVRALRAVADDHQAATAVGIPLKTIWVAVWAVSGIVALVAGIMWGAKSGVQFSLSLIALKALPVLILGGLTSIPGAIVGGLIIGVGEKIAEVYWGPAIGGAIENWFAYVLAMVFLMFRPHGLFGEEIIERV